MQETDWKPRPGLLPYWLYQKRRGPMLVTDSMRKIVVFIGHKSADGDFFPDGTGFLLLLEAHSFGFFYVVTAKHVIDQAAGKDRDRQVLLRVNTKDGGIDYIPTTFKTWQTHPDHTETGRKQRYIDVAVYGLVNYREWGKSNIDKLDFSYIMEEDFCTDEIIKKYMIGLGDEVSIPGLFLSHIGTSQNVPIVRTGNIAALRGEPVPTSYGPMDGYLVEMRSVGGISGSPVVANMAVRPNVIYPGSPVEQTIEHSEKAHYLLGLIHGHYTITTQDEWVFKTDQQVGDINAGIAVVVPISKVTETIEASSLFAEDFEMARQFREMENAKSGAKPDSAPSAASPSPASEVPPPANGENPKHREDFTRLVGAAARKQEPEG
jgi:hypothetical protein